MIEQADPFDREADLDAGGTLEVASRERLTPGDGLGELVGPLLAALADLGQFDSTYVTAIDWQRRQQEVRYVHTNGDCDVPAGMRIDCPADLSERVFLGATRSNELPTVQPDSLIARNLGLATYASVPIITADHRLYGTLCGLTHERRERL